MTARWLRNALWASALLAAHVGPAGAEVVTFGWDPVDDARVGVYVLAWGNHSVAEGGKYAVGEVAVLAPATTATTPDLAAQPWFFAVKACTADKSLCSDWSNEVRVDMLGPISPPAGLRLQSMTFSVE